MFLTYLNTGRSCLTAFEVVCPCRTRIVALVETSMVVSLDLLHHKYEWQDRVLFFN